MNETNERMKQTVAGLLTGGPKTISDLAAAVRKAGWRRLPATAIFADYVAGLGFRVQRGVVGGVHRRPCTLVSLPGARS